MLSHPPMGLLAYLLGFAESGVARFLFLLPIFAGIVVLETVAPVIGARAGAISRLRSLVLWFAFLVCGLLLSGLVSTAVARLHIHPLLPTWAFPGGVLCALVVGDFAYYWFHRFEHRFLWRWHAVHHSPRELHGLAGYSHPADGLLQSMFWGLPAGLLMPNPYGPPLLLLINMIWGQYVHSNTVLGLGRWRVILADNRFHRIHHSLAPDHWDHNFGVMFPWWDMMFGTAWMPATDEWPDVGVPEYGEIQGVGEFLLRPLLPAMAQSPSSPLQPLRSPGR